MNDLFTKFWSDYFNTLAAGQPAPQVTPGSDVWKQMQRAFLDAMARYADEFMRSPQFLDAMKQTLDNAMAFRRQMDEMMTQTLRSAQVPTQQDARELADRLHGLERRVIERIDRLEQKVSALEAVSTPKRATTNAAPARAATRRAAKMPRPRMKK
jgi:polyhydroxyalkanoate synthesis regulator phasin